MARRRHRVGLKPGGGSEPARLPPTPISQQIKTDPDSHRNSLFADISPTDSFCKHAHYLAAYNVAFGCGSTNYCPGQTVTRDAMAAFLARALAVALGGAGAVPPSYGPDPVTGRSYSCNAGSPSIHFTDVPASNAFCKSIHYLWARGIVDGCSATQYCATAPVSRDAMAKFITRGFGLELY